jgi:hypothetical protein
MADVTCRGAAKLAVVALLVFGVVAPAGAGPGNGRVPDLDPYDIIDAPEGHKVAFRAYAEGVQIYRWNGTSWTFVGPEALLYDQDDEVVGIHYGGPTWESESGSTVVGRVVDRVTPNPNAIPWLLLESVSSEGPGIFRRVTYIQRINTTGGLAPAFDGDFVGEEIGVPYTADYVFYRKHK